MLQEQPQKSLCIHCMLDISCPIAVLMLTSSQLVCAEEKFLQPPPISVIT